MARRETIAFQEFLVEAKSYWMSGVFPALRREYQARAADKKIDGPEQVASLIGDLPLYRYYAWLERHIQREKYSGRYGLIRNAEESRGALEAGLARVSGDSDLLTLADDIPIPAWYSDVDTHQHPGNLTGDSLAGYVYKASAGSTQPGQTVGYRLHERFADIVAESGAFKTILDVGCGFGKSTITLAQRLPAAAVEGIDLSRPCLELAALEASESQVRNIRYRQADACNTPYADQSFDLVTSTMLLHELPTEIIQEQLRETYRLLPPGGTMIHLDFQVRDPFLRFLHHGHGVRNNEPYMEDFDRLDVPAAMKAAGFVEPVVTEFFENGPAEPRNPDIWRLPWVVFAARKPGADV